MTPQPDGYEAILFDFDGVLVEPTDRTYLENAIEDALLQFGVEEPAESVIDGLLRKDRSTLRTLSARYGIDPGALWARRERNAITEQVAATRDGDKPIYEDVACLEDLSLPLAVVSNNQHETVTTILEYYGLADRFETIYGREPSLAGLERTKPDPHYLHNALSDLDATDALYVGDKLTDIQAASRANVDAAFLRRDHDRRIDFDVEPTFDCESLADLLMALESDPTDA